MKTDSQLQQDVMAEPQRRATADARTIALQVSWSECNLATRSAWGTAALRKVVDKMGLVY